MEIAAVIIYANNCTDDTVAVARGASLPFALTIIEAEMPAGAADIGHARRAATNAAAAHLLALGRPQGIVASTDADSRVGPGWLSALSHAFAPDVDAVCGVIDLDGAVNPGLIAKRGAEAAYAETVAEICDHLDPRVHDPWPNHIWSWGANFAVRAQCLINIGEPPLVSLGEDRALHAALLHHDMRIRHDSAVRVRTSARAKGRVPGGFADLLTNYADDPAALADFALEPAAISWARAASRGRIRQRWGKALGFGAFWAEQEILSAALARQRIAVKDLSRHTALLRAWLKAATDQCDSLLPGPGTRPVRMAASLQ